MKFKHAIRRRYWKYFIYLICGIMLITPFSETFDPTSDEMSGKWMKNYVLNSFEYSIVIIPIIILLIIIPRLENRTPKKISIATLCFLSGIAFLVALQSISLPIQDFIPQWGILILIILFPVTVIDSFIEWKRKTLNTEEVE